MDHWLLIIICYLLITDLLWWIIFERTWVSIVVYINPASQSKAKCHSVALQWAINHLGGYGWQTINVAQINKHLAPPIVSWPRSPNSNICRDSWIVVWWFAFYIGRFYTGAYRGQCPCKNVPGPRFGPPWAMIKLNEINWSSFFTS